MRTMPKRRGGIRWLTPKEQIVRDRRRAAMVAANKRLREQVRQAQNAERGVVDLTYSDGDTTEEAESDTEEPAEKEEEPVDLTE